MIIKLEPADSAVAIDNLKKKGRCLNEASQSLEQKTLFNYRRVVKLNPEVANIRIISGTSPESIVFTKRLLSYQNSLPLSERGISTLVIDKQNIEQLQRTSHKASGSETLYEKLLNEGVEIIPLERILEFSKLNFPDVDELITLLEKHPMKYNPDAHFPESTYNKMLTYIIKLILPAFFFSQDKTEQLKAVTVTELNVKSSLFLPAKARKTDASFLAMARTSFSYKSSCTSCNYDSGFSARMDGDLLAKIEANAITSSKKNFRIIDNDKSNEGILNLITNDDNFYKNVDFEFDSIFSINSHDSAIQLAVKTNILLNSLANMLGIFRIRNLNEESISGISGIEAIEHAGNTDGHSCLYIELNGHEGECLKFSDQILYTYFQLLHRNVEYNFFFHELREQAIRNNLGIVINTRSSSETINVKYDHVKNRNKIIAFLLNNPYAVFISKDIKGLRMFINNSFLSASREMKATYSMASDFERYEIGKKKQVRDDVCIPVFGLSQAGKISKLHWNKTEHMYDSITSSEKIDHCECGPLDLPGTKIINVPLQAAPTDNSPSPTVGECFTAGLYSGLISGAIEGGCSYYCGERFLVKFLTRAALGYLTGGAAGFGLSITGYGLSALPSLLRKKSHRGSLQRGVALLVENSAIALPVISGNYVKVIGGEIGYRSARFAIKKSIQLLELLQCRKRDEPSQKEFKKSRNKSRATIDKITVQKAFKEVPGVVHDVVPERVPVESKRDSEEIVIKKLNELFSPEVSNKTETERLRKIISLVEELVSHGTEKINKFTPEILSSLNKTIPWTFEKIRTKFVKAYLKKLTDKKSREDFIIDQLKLYEHHKGFWDTTYEFDQFEDYGNAVCKNPDLYLLYIHNVEWPAIQKLDNLFSALNKNNPDNIIKAITKKILENHDAKEAFHKLNILNLPPDQKMDIFRQLDHDRQLYLVNNNSKRVIGLFYCDYIQSKKMKKEGAQQKIKSMQNWLRKFDYNPSFGDELISYLLPENQPDENNQLYMDTFERFKRQLKRQAERDLNDKNRSITKMRAKTILLLVEQAI